MKQQPQSVRDQFLEAAISELAENGTEFFDTTKVCLQLHVSRSLVNYYFGSHIGLIVEATVISYERYAEQLKLAAAKRKTPTARLEAWMKAQHDWFTANRGIAALLQMAHPIYADVFHERFESRMQSCFRYNMAVLATLVRDVQNEEVTPLNFDASSAPFSELLSQSMEMLCAPRALA